MDGRLPQKEVSQPVVVDIQDLPTAVRRCNILPAFFFVDLAGRYIIELSRDNLVRKVAHRLLPPSRGAIPDKDLR